MTEEMQETTHDDEIAVEPMKDEPQDEEFAQEESLVTQQIAGDISAQSVQMRQAGAQSIRARQVIMRQGGAVTIDADSVEVQQGGVGLIRAGEAHLGLGTRTAAVLADAVTLDQGMAQVVVSRDTADIRQSMVGVMVGQHITANGSTVMVMIADSVEGGSAQVALNRQSAVVFGAAVGASMALVTFLLHMLRRRS